MFFDFVKMVGQGCNIDEGGGYQPGHQKPHGFPEPYLFDEADCDAFVYRMLRLGPDSGHRACGPARVHALTDVFVAGDFGQPILSDVSVFQKTDADDCYPYRRRPCHGDRLKPAPYLVQQGAGQRRRQLRVAAQPCRDRRERLPR